MHLVRLAQVATIAEGEAIDSGELATVTAGVITTVDRCAGSWNITARSNGHDSWLAISERSYGRVVAERDTDPDDVTAVVVRRRSAVLDKRTGASRDEKWRDVLTIRLDR